jgi:hypothetical protein
MRFIGWFLTGLVVVACLVVGLSAAQQWWIRRLAQDSSTHGFDPVSILRSRRRYPGAKDHDVALMETWIVARTLADGCPQQCKAGSWQNSGLASWVPASNRTDAWGHSLCFKWNGSQTVVVSAGSKADSSPECSALTVADSEIAGLPVDALPLPSPGRIVMIFGGEPQAMVRKGAKPEP